jgi:glycosyltransferase involved in cell wall biosynthesis
MRLNRWPVLQTGHGMSQRPGAIDAAFLVNGGFGSAAGERAERIAAELGSANTVVTYRAASRSGTVSEMRRALAEHRPKVAYAMDLAAAPIDASTPARGAAAMLGRVGYGKSSRIIVRGSHHRTQLVDAGYDRVSVIPDSVDLSFFRPVEVDALRTQLGLDNTLTVGVQGNFTWFPQLGGGIGWDLIEAVGRNQDLNVRAVIVRSGPGIAELRVLAGTYGISDRLHAMGRVPYPDLPSYLSLCDVCLLTQTNDPSSWARTTGKLPRYLAAGRHILASRVGTAADLLPEDMLIGYDDIAKQCADEIRKGFDSNPTRWRAQAEGHGRRYRGAPRRSCDSI